MQPQRSQGNTRYYDDLQLRRLLNIVSLLELDHKISDVASMPDETLFNMLEQAQPFEISDQHPHRFYILQLIKAGMSYNEPAFDKLFSHALLHLGMKQTYLVVLYPLLVQVGLMWSRNRMPPAQEHFISNLVRQKLYTAIDGLPIASPGTNKWLLFLPEDEFHELGLLFACYLVRQAGYQCICLGANVPADSVIKAARDVNPDFFLTFFIHKDSKAKTEAYLKRIISGNKERKILIGGEVSYSKNLRKEKNIMWLHTVDDLMRHLE